MEHLEQAFRLRELWDVVDDGKDVGDSEAGELQLVACSEEVREV